MAQMIRPALLRALQIAVAGALMGLLWHVADGASAMRHLAEADPLLLLAALVALSAQTVISALRWRLTAGQLGMVLDRRRAIGEYYLSQIVNQTLPGGMLGDAGRALRARAQAGLIASGQAVLFERLSGQMALLALFCGSMAGTLAMPGGFDWPGWLFAPVVSALAGGLAAGLLLWGLGSRLTGHAGRGLAGLARAFRRAVTAPEVRLRQALLSLATALCNVLAFACAAAAVGIFLPPATALTLVPLILFTMLIPVTISGWGLREGAAAALLPLAGVGAAQGFAASIAFGLVLLVAAMPGAFVMGFGGVQGAMPPGETPQRPSVN